ncbi:MAG: phosphoribosylformylglycinamidine synthase subunit PurQ [Nanoarchaeota archaeon]|nr:phosphoribosylformylglycinamidine synthase subunit PurQ [Nanoarchaeota archaeon]
MKIPKALIITGDGLNCEDETKYAFNLAKAEPKLVHITNILDGDYKINDAQMLAFIGGFANGDHLGAGTVQAVRFRHKLWDDLQEFIEKKKPIIAICNGFQTAVNMGILPGIDQDYRKRSVTLMTNDSGVFEDRWVYLKANPDSPCIWTKGIKKLFAPVRHGEGKFYTHEEGMIDNLFENNQVVLQYAGRNFVRPTMDYPLNPNGSLESIAGICDETGTIFGLMPHPEAYLHAHNHPDWTYLKAIGKKLPKEGQGVKIFRNAVKYVKEM